MKLISTRNTSTVVARDARHEAIAIRYGSAMEMLTRFSPANLRVIADNISRSVEADVPSVVSMIITYGTEDMAALLKMHVAAAMVAAGIERDKIDDGNIEEIALDMLSSPSYRTLNMAYALGFFQALRFGEYKLYSCRPIDFMNALHEYCIKAHDEQRRLAEEKRRVDIERQRTEDARRAVTFRQYCESKGLDPATTPNPLDMLR